jgi:hypothetical protein
MLRHRCTVLGYNLQLDDDIMQRQLDEQVFKSTQVIPLMCGTVAGVHAWSLSSAGHAADTHSFLTRGFVSFCRCIQTRI